MGIQIPTKLSCPLSFSTPTSTFHHCHNPIGHKLLRSTHIWVKNVIYFKLCFTACQKISVVFTTMNVASAPSGNIGFAVLSVELVIVVCSLPCLVVVSNNTSSEATTRGTAVSCEVRVTWWGELRQQQHRNSSTWSKLVVLETYYRPLRCVSFLGGQVLGSWQASKKVWMIKLHAGSVLSGSVWACLYATYRRKSRRIILCYTFTF